MVVAVRYYNEAKDSVWVRQNITGFERTGGKVSFYFSYDIDSLEIKFGNIADARQLEEWYQNALVDEENHIFWFCETEDGRTNWGVKEVNHG